MSAPALTVVFVGDSISGGIPPGGTQTPGEIACATLSTWLGMTVNFQLASFAGSAFGGTGGAQTIDDLPGQANYLAALAQAAGTPHIFHLVIGSNDARYSGLSPSAYHANMVAITSGLAATGGKVVVGYSPAFDTSVGGLNTPTALALVHSYEPQIDSLVDNTSIFQGDTTIYNLILANLSWLYDGGHPDATHGVPAIGNAWALALLPVVARYVQWNPPAAAPMPWG